MDISSRVIQVLISEHSSSVDTARRSEIVPRMKARFILCGRSHQLSAARSVKELLMVMYDIVEVHRVLVNDWGYLHRVFNLCDFLIHIDYANDVPRWNKGEHCALIIDTDSGAKPTPIDDTTLDTANGEFAARIGTPRFIARAVAGGKFLEQKFDSQFTAMPELRGKAKDVYLTTYGQTAYDVYTDIAEDTYHGGKLHKPLPDLHSRTWAHRPDHDIESIFWIFAYVLVMATPLDALDEPFQDLVKEWDNLRSHDTVKLRLLDYRAHILIMTEKSWSIELHSKLTPIARTMVQLTDQISPEYGYLEPPPKADHLHEALRRILLNQILSMKDPIRLHPNTLREFDVRGEQERKRWQDPFERWAFPHEFHEYIERNRRGRTVVYY